MTAPPALDDLDAWISEEDLFRQPPDIAGARRDLALHQALEHLRQGLPAFDRYCERLGWSKSDGRLPYLPSTVFKSAHAMVRVAGTAGVETTSSCTRGSVSRVWRDDLTRMRLFGSVVAGVRGVLSFENTDAVAFDLGPQLYAVNHLWISYVLAGVSPGTRQHLLRPW